jgi:hypothetical protein
MTKTERAAERSRLLSLAATVGPEAPVGLRICAAGIRENLTQPRGTLKRALEAAATLARLQAAR